MSLELLLPDRLSTEGSESYGDLIFVLREGVIGYPELYGVVGQRFEGGEDWRVGASRVVVAGLAEAVIVDDAPGEDGPAVVQLPEESARTVGLAATEVLEGELQAFGL